MPFKTRYHHRSKAGNFADVHKHWLLTLLLRHLRRRAGPLCYAESHAGSGRYKRKTNEKTAHGYADGIDKLWYDRTALPDSVTNYLTIVDCYNLSQQLQAYPGSPLFARRLLRAHDSAVLHEKQTTVFSELETSLQNDRRFSLHHGDGYSGIAQRLRRRQGRQLLLIDPPYSEAKEMQQSARLLEGFRPSLKQTVIALWYPLFADHRESGYVEGLRSHPGMGTWTSELHLTCTSNGKLRGSGMLLVNAPQGVRAEAETDGVILAERLDGEMRYWRPS